MLTREFIDWMRRSYAGAPPLYIKQECLIRNSIKNAAWVETGTYLGQTTSMLAKNFPKVFSIAPEINLFNDAKSLFEDVKHEEIIHGISEQEFQPLIS